MRNVLHASLLNMGSYYGVTVANSNMIDSFNTELVAANLPEISTIRQFAIEAPEGTEITINDTIVITIPGTGLFELPLDYYQITSLSFSDVAEINIVYFY